MKKITIFSVIYLFIISSVFAHDNLTGQINTVSQRIKLDSKNPSLYLKRGELYLLHKNFKKAIKDFKTSKKIDNSKFIANYMIALTLLESKKYKKANKYIKKYIYKKPKDASGYLLSARIYQKLENNILAKEDFKKAFLYLKNPNPSNYIEIADAILENDFSNYKEAISWLNKGEEKFSFSIVLKEKKISVLTDANQYSSAIKVIDEILFKLKRKEKWLYRKGLLYEKSGKLELAKLNYKKALSHINKLPDRLKRTGSMLELETLILIQMQND